MSAFVAMSLALMLLQAPAMPAGKAEDPDQKIVCKSERFVGSKISQRICKTRAEWDFARRQAQELLDERQGQSTMTTPRPDGG
jgi:hypothetical protein